MTNQEYWKLIQNKQIAPKIFHGFKQDGTELTIETFTFNSFYFLRIITDFKYITGIRNNGKKYRMNRHACFFKKFSNKNSANKYYSKVIENATIKRMV